MLYKTLKKHGYTLTGHASNRGDRVVDLMPIKKGLYVDDQFRVRYSPTGELVFKNKYKKPTQQEGILLRMLLFPTDVFVKHKRSYLESYPENTDNTFGVQIAYIRRRLREFGIELINDGEMLKPRIEDKNMELSRNQKAWRKINFEIISEKYIVTTKEQQDTVYNLLTQCLINNELISGYMLMTNGICSKPIE